MNLADHIGLMKRRSWLTIAAGVAMKEPDYAQHLYPYNATHTPPTVVVDFDGTLAHRHGGRSLIGPMKKNSVALINELHRLGYEVIIMSANPQLDLIGRALVQNGIQFARVTSVKPPAVAYVDDRAVRWTGDMPVADAIAQIKELTPKQ